MSTIPLPNDPNLEQLRRQAKELRDAVRRSDADALTLLSAHYPKGDVEAGERPRFTLSAAQLVIARRYGFASWARLKHHLDVVARHIRTPDRAGAQPNPADEFMRLACLNYGDDVPANWSDAQRLLHDHPDIPAHSIHAAATANDVAAVRRHLDAQPASVSAEGGPFAWTPLLYLAYSRVDPDAAMQHTLSIAQMLLDAGADPNDGFLWHGLPSPFTVLTAVFGEGELGPRAQPRHPRSIEFARLLLEAGADANDSQALYNRMFLPDNSHLELLFEFGLGRGTGGVWKRRLGDALETPTELVRFQLQWAVNHGMVERTQLLLDHGVDALSPFADGRTPVETAAVAGQAAIVALLEAHGAQAQLDEPDRLIAAALLDDRASVDRISAQAPTALERARARRPGLAVWAAAHAPQSITLLVELGFDVNALGRSDIPREEEWQTALHVAAGDGNIELVRQLLALGADPSIHDRQYDAPPLGWAHHFERRDVIDLLTPLTPPRA